MFEAVVSVAHVNLLLLYIFQVFFASENCVSSCWRMSGHFLLMFSSLLAPFWRSDGGPVEVLGVSSSWGILRRSWWQVDLGPNRARWIWAQIKSNSI